MAVSMDRVRVVWSGFAGSPGLSTFYVTSAVSAVPVIHTFFDAIKAALPTEVAIQVQGDGDTLQDTDGRLLGSFSVAAPAVVAGTGSSGFSAASGSCVDWVTNSVAVRRRVMGRTFLVPLATGAYNSDGQLLPTLRTTLATAASSMISGNPGMFFCWHRPKGASPGAAEVVTGARVPSKVAVLRSRRD